MPSKATGRQLAYLRSLAEQTGQTFTYPKTSRQASAEINRLKHTQPSSQTEKRIERKLIADQIAAGPADSARVRDHEIAGHGATATWAHTRDPQAHATNESAAARVTPNVGKRTELARYTTPAGERILYGQRIDGTVRITDRPAGAATASARSYLVERGVHTKAELDALMADYLHTAEQLHAIPMSVTPLERYLEHLT